MIDIRVDLPASVTPAILESMHNEIRDLYPGKDQRLYLQGEFSAGNYLGATAMQKLIGFAFSSEVGKQVCQARLDGFTLSRLKPYESWRDLRTEAKRLWDIYRTITAPLEITRTAVRYVNQIDIPSATIDYKDFFRTTPEISPTLPQALSGFFMELQLPQPDFAGMLILTQTAVPPPTMGHSSIILDLDVFKQAPAPISETEAWDLLEILRNRKNELFEGSITDKTRELFGRREEY